MHIVRRREIEAREFSQIWGTNDAYLPNYFLPFYNSKYQSQNWPIFVQKDVMAMYIRSEKLIRFFFLSSIYPKKLKKIP